MVLWLRKTGKLNGVGIYVEMNPISIIPLRVGLKIPCTKNFETNRFICLLSSACCE